MSLAGVLLGLWFYFAIGGVFALYCHSRGVKPGRVFFVQATWPYCLRTIWRDITREL